MIKNELYQLAKSFRNAMEIVIEREQYGKLTLFRNFPKGCCQYTADLLAEYLLHNGIPKEQIVAVSSETLQDRYTHYWLLVYDTYFVDITADQFMGKTLFIKYASIPACLVVPRNTYLYEMFDEQNTRYSHEIGIDTYGSNEATQNELRNIYDAIVIQIDKNKSKEALL